MSAGPLSYRNRVVRLGVRIVLEVQTEEAGGWRKAEAAAERGRG